MGLLAIGGAAVGLFAMGGGAFGVYAAGGGAFASEIAIGGSAHAPLAIGRVAEGALTLRRAPLPSKSPDLLGAELVSGTHSKPGAAVQGEAAKGARSVSSDPQAHFENRTGNKFCPLRPPVWPDKNVPKHS